MGFASPLGLLALLAVPAVLLLHKLRRRLVERRVAGLFLFAPEAMKEDAGRTLSPLLRTASLWLELLGAVLLALLLAGPTLSDDRPPRHLVVVLDDTASMGARLGDRTVADEARRHVRARVDEMPADAVVTIVKTGRPPSMLVGPRATRASTAAALEAWTPVGTSSDPSPALDLALELADPGDDVLLVTDEADPDVPPRVEVAAFGRALDGAAIASARRYASALGTEPTETLAIDVVAYARAPYSTEVIVSAGLDEPRTSAGPTGPSRIVARKVLTVDPARPTRLTLDVPASDLPLRVLLFPDPLAIDGEAILLPEPLRVVPYAITMAPETAAALRLSDRSPSPGVLAGDRLSRSVPGLRRVPEADAALVFADAEGAPRPGTTRVVVAAAAPAPGAAPAGDNAAAERDDWLGPFLLDRASGLVEGLTLQGVVWSAGRGQLAGRGLAFVGEHALFAEESIDGHLVLRLNLDPARSTLAASADWPILLSNIVERARASLPGPASSNVRVGESVVYRVAAGDRLRGDGGEGAWRLVAPSGRAETVRGEGLLVFDPKEPGLHRLVEGDRDGGRDGERDAAHFSVQFVDGRESDLRSRGASRRAAKAAIAAEPGAAAAAAAGPSNDSLASGLAVRLLALALLAIVAADAWVLARVASGARARRAAA